MSWAKSSFWSITVSHSTSQQVLWHISEHKVLVNTKSLISPIHLLCQLPLVSYIHIWEESSKTDVTTHIVLADL